LAYIGVLNFVFAAQTIFNPDEDSFMIQVQNLSIRFPGFALQDIFLTLENREFFSLLGPTGAGKTLILESIAGLVQPSGGRILINDRDVTGLPPERRGVGIVYQDQALFPHLSVRKNIAFGLRYHRKSVVLSDQSIDLLVKRLGLISLLDRSVHDLSGGEKQRVALARALAINPAVLLLDEPLSSLDPNFREEIRQLLKYLHRETAITVLMVTHDFSEAHFLAQRVAVINAGRIEQVGRVATVFQQPATPFVAEFVGMKNIFPAVFNGSLARVGKLSFQINGRNSGHSCLAIRPEHIVLFVTRPERRHPNLIEGFISRICNQGVYSDVAVDAGGIQLQSILPTSNLHTMNLMVGHRIFISVAPEHIHFI
jgi:molybdate/tungstate transport system ATP-binding protein